MVTRRFLSHPCVSQVPGLLKQPAYTRTACNSVDRFSIMAISLPYLSSCKFKIQCQLLPSQSTLPKKDRLPSATCRNSFSSLSRWSWVCPNTRLPSGMSPGFLGISTGPWLTHETTGTYSRTPTENPRQRTRTPGTPDGSPYHTPTGPPHAGERNPLAKSKGTLQEKSNA